MHTQSVCWQEPSDVALRLLVPVSGNTLMFSEPSNDMVTVTDSSIFVSTLARAADWYQSLSSVQTWEASVPKWFSIYETLRCRCSNQKELAKAIKEQLLPVCDEQRRAISVLVRVEENPICDLLGLDFVHCFVVI